MPSNPLISREPSFKDLERFMTKELKPRVLAVKKEILKSISQNALEGIKARAPHQGLDHYEQDLVNAGMPGDDHCLYAVLYRGKPVEKGEGKDHKVTLLYIRSKKRKVGKWAGVFRVLAEYGPFTLDTWPVQIPQALGMIYYRTADEHFVKHIRDKNVSHAVEIVSKLKSAGVRLTVSDFTVNADKLDIIEDIAFKVARLEKGLGGAKAYPHWRPGIEASRSTDSLNKIKDNEDIIKTLSDPNFQGWKKLGKIRDKVSPKDIDDIEKFQKLIGVGK